MSVDWSDQLDEIYEAHQTSVENELCKMVDAFAASVSESPSKGAKVRRFFESLCHTVSNICNGVRTKSIDDKKALKMSSTKTLDEIVFGAAANVVYDDDEMRGVDAARNRRDSESSHSEWSTKDTDYSARSGWPTDRSVDNESHTNDDIESKVDGMNVAFDSRSSTPLISENDIDRFLDFKRAGDNGLVRKPANEGGENDFYPSLDIVKKLVKVSGVAKKRRCSRESDECSANKRDRRVSDEQRRSDSSRRAFSESKRNQHTKSKPDRTTDSRKPDFRSGQIQLSNDAAQRLRSVTAPFLEAELNHWNKIRAFCYFCEDNLEISYVEWSEHLLLHTGEHPFYCTGCNVGLPKYQPEHCARYKTKPQIKGGNLTAHLCNECDYIQFNMNHVIDHIVGVHMRSGRDVENSLDKVILLPDLRLVPKLARTQYKYVPIKYRFGCGIKGCHITGNSIDQFTEHFTQKHSNARMFSCPHCKDIITNVSRDAQSFIVDILNHYKLHNDVINQCSVCDMTFHGDYAVIHHFLTRHTDECCIFHREFRANLSQGIEDVVILFECNRCHARLVDSPVQHYLKCHHSHHADFTLIELVKQMDEEKVTKFRMVEFEDKILFQQHFSCGWCHEMLSTKSQLIRHHIVQHRSFELNIEFKLNLTRSSYHSKLLAINSSFDQYLIYFCDNCDNSDQLNCRFYSDIDDVYNHWMDNHSKGEHSKPFRFTLAPLVECYHCKLISTFMGMKTHHDQHHPNEQFAIRHLIDRTKCGLCLADYRLSPATHFQQEHKTVLKTKLFNPIALDGDTLTRLRNLKGHTKRQCLICSEVFETKNDFKYHRARKHPHSDVESKKFHDNESVHLVAGCCQETIKPIELIEHLKAHDFTSTSRMEKYYWNTLAVFGNGLVLEMHNLINCSEFGHSSQLHELIEHIKEGN